MNKKATITLNIGAVLLAGIFALFGGGKFMDPTKWIDKFIAWGLPEWFVPVAGALELMGAIGLLIPIVRSFAGFGLALFMIGAVTVHIVHAEIGMIFVAGAILAGSAAIGWFRLPESRDYCQRQCDRKRTDQDLN